MAYGLLWSLANITAFTFEYKKEGKPMKLSKLKGIFNIKLQAFNKLASGATTYTETIEIITTIINMCV